MPKRAFLLLTALLTFLVILTTPAFLSPLLPHRPLMMATATPTVTHTPTATATPDPFAGVPTATPLGRQISARILPTLPPVATAVPPATATAYPVAAASQPRQPSAPPTAEPTSIVILPDTSAATTRASIAPASLPPLPAPSGATPDRIVIPRLALDAPVEPVGMVPSSAAAGVYEWGVPNRRAAGWLNTTAPFAIPGNTVLDGHHNIAGEVFRNLWTLQPGDEITLFAGEMSRRYTVQQVLILPERGQPLAVRLKNARFIQPTADERLTLITCYPYESNTHRVVVVATPPQ